jgi:hypothetical protein
MSESDQFRRYAEEAMLWVAQSKTEEEKQILDELLCTWTAAAVASARPTIAQTARSHRRRFSGWRVKVMRPAEAADHPGRPCHLRPRWRGPAK